MPLADTGRTSDPQNMRKYGVDIGTTDYGKAAIVFNGQKAIYDPLLADLGLVDCTVTSIPLQLPYSKYPKTPVVATLILTVAETTAGADGIVNTYTNKLKCSVKKVESAISTLVGKNIGSTENPRIIQSVSTY